jgi:hypothetical protein
MNQRWTFTSLASFAALAVTATALGLSACSSSSSNGSGATDAGVSDAPEETTDGSASPDGAIGSNGDSGAASACAAYAQARCARLDACSNATYTVLHYGSHATCVSDVAAQCATSLAAPQTAATPGYFSGCATALATESCSDLLGANPPPACTPLAGPLAAGAACFASAQCQSTYCAVASTANCGVCAALPAAGATCAVDADCGSRNSLTCSKAGTCVAYGAAGASCDKDDPCGPSLSCVGADAKTSTPGTCTASAAAVGAACDPTTGAGCDATLLLTCDGVTKQCVADTLVTASQVCGSSDGSVARCEANGTCEIPDAGPPADGGDAGAAVTTGTCLAAAATGAACDSASGPACVPPAKCIVTDDAGTAGTCQLGSPNACN